MAEHVTMLIPENMFHQPVEPATWTNLSSSYYFAVLGDDANITTSNLERVDDREGGSQITIK